MADDPAPDFPQSNLPGVAAMLASLQASKVGKRAMGDLHRTAPTNLREIVSIAGTPLEQLAEFTRGEVDDLTAFAASRGVTARMMAAPNPASGSYYTPGSAGLDKLMRRFSPDAADATNDALRQMGVAGGTVEHIGLGSTSVPTAMHEIGHASPILGSSTLRNVWQRIVGLTGGRGGDAARLLLAANAIRGGADEGGGVASFTREHAPALMAASYAPQLLEEGRATGAALMGARRFGPGVLATARELLPALGTYGAHAAGPVLGTLLAQKIMQALRDRGEEKQAAPTAGKEVQTPGILRSSASSAWRMGVSVPKPKTIKPNSSPTARAKDTPTAKPPSKTAFYSDMIQSLNNPQRGFRQSKPEG